MPKRKLTQEEKEKLSQTRKDRKELTKEQLKQKFLEYYKDLPIQKLAGDFIGRDETTIFRWKEEDENFANQIANAKAEWAMNKSKKVRSDEWLLERVMKDHFAPRTEVTGKEGKDFNITVQRYPENKDANQATGNEPS